MKDYSWRDTMGLVLGCTALIAIGAPKAHAVVDGMTGNTVSLVAKTDYINTADGNTIFMYGFGLGNSTAAQLYYPGPTMIVNEGDTVTITLTNTLDEPVSLVFPGQTGVTATAVKGKPSAQGLITLEAGAATGQVTYSFVATHPGTFMYHSGTNQNLQTEMGLVGALIVRPKNFNASAPTAYDDPSTKYDREYLFLETDIDPVIHTAVDQSTAVPKSSVVDISKRFANYWFFNGRNGPDTLQDAYVPWLPAQPYSTMPQIHPGETALMRVIGGGLDVHPFHHHGNHAFMIGRDGMLSQSASGKGADVAEANFTIQTAPGETYDATFTWTGAGLNWDYLGRKPTDPTCTAPGASPDCGKPFPVKYPNPITLSAGPHYSGSPYLGQMGQLPPAEGGFNVNGGNYFMWHSHTEKELTNYNIYPGGMMTFMVIQPVGVEIP
jgi:hypothetical protein